jgi:hypothetical protein
MLLYKHKNYTVVIPDLKTYKNGFIGHVYSNISNYHSKKIVHNCHTDRYECGRIKKDDGRENILGDCFNEYVILYYAGSNDIDNDKEFLAQLLIKLLKPSYSIIVSLEEKYINLLKTPKKLGSRNLDLDDLNYFDDNSCSINTFIKSEYKLSPIKKLSERQIEILIQPHFKFLNRSKDVFFK